MALCTRILDLYSLFCLILLPGTKQSCYGLIWQWDIWLVIYSWCLFEWFLLSVLVCFLVWFRSSFQAHKLIFAELLKAGRSHTKGWEVMLKELMFRPSISPLFFPPLTFLHPHPSCLGQMDTCNSSLHSVSRAFMWILSVSPFSLALPPYSRLSFQLLIPDNENNRWEPLFRSSLFPHPTIPISCSACRDSFVDGINSGHAG